LLERRLRHHRPERRDRIIGHDPAAVQDDDARDDMLDGAKLVRAEHDDLPSRGQFLNQAKD
jgi:hypothetical protein